MASTTHTLLTLVALVTALASSSSAPVAKARPLSISISNPSTSPLASQLKLEGSNCWESLLQLQACSGEIVMFFLNGETYLGQGCCQAIRVIGRECWPNVVGSLGFTTQETDMLQGYCDEEEGVHSPPPPPIPLLTPAEPKGIAP